MVINWTKKEDDVIRKNWGKINAIKISCKLSNRTKNAVIGRARRLGLPLLQTGHRGVTKNRINTNIQRCINKKEEILAIKRDMHLSRIERLDPKNGCRWMYGDPTTDNFAFCGCRRVVDAPYCVDHCRQAFIKR